VLRPERDSPIGLRYAVRLEASRFVEGLVLSERYRLVSQLGQGGMGSVWRAEHVELGTPAAVKLIDPEIASNEEALSRFKREAQAAATLRSPHVVQILDYGVDNGTPYIAMELMEGESLADRLERVGRLDTHTTATIMNQVARAVSKAHEIGIVHRDLKPDNIYLVRNEDEELAKVLDFGIAKSTGDGFGAMGAPETRTGAMLGTPYYMSPEQAGGKKTVDHRSDTWAMAVIAFECLLGRRPFDSDTLGGLVLTICTEAPPVPSHVGPVPLGFDEWFAKATARSPDDRFQTARELASELKVICGIGRAEMPSTVDGELPSGPYSAQQPYGMTPNSASAHLLLSASGDEATEVARPGMIPGAVTPQPAFGATAQQAAPTSITVNRTQSSKGGLVAIAVGAMGLLLLAAGGAALWALTQGGEKVAPAAAVSGVDPVPEVASAKPEPQVAPAPTSDDAVVSLEDLPAEPTEEEKKAEAKAAAKPAPAAARQPAGAPKPTPQPAAPKPAAPKPPAPAGGVDLAF